MKKNHLPLNDKEKNNTFYGKTKNINTVGFATVLTYTPKKGILFEEPYIHTAKITAIKIALKEI